MEGHWALLGYVTGLIGAWTAIIIGVIYVLFNRFCKNIDNQIAAYLQGVNTQIEERLKKLTAVEGEIRKLEVQIWEIKADLPCFYIRKEDHIRHEVVINAKLDRIYDLVKS